jgi:delta8-fatty-acid desaturase
MNRNKLFSVQEVKDRILKGQTIVISEGRVLRLDGWLDRHPGGRLAVMHMVGRDASNEINM